MSSLNNIFNLTPRIIQENFTCNICKQLYKKKWCDGDNKSCYFCRNFLPMRDTYASILREIDWHFLRSRENDKKFFYSEFLDSLKIWADRFHVFPTKQDQTLEKELRDIF